MRERERVTEKERGRKREKEKVTKREGETRASERKGEGGTQTLSAACCLLPAPIPSRLHTLFVLFVVPYAHISLQENLYIAFPVQLEKQLMEGTYNKV
jgi:hypothetical protein